MKHILTSKPSTGQMLDYRRPVQIFSEGATE